MQENQNVKVLNEVYKGAKMGVGTISYMLPKINNTALKKDLANQMLGYHNFVKSSSKSLHNVHHYPSDPGPLTKIPAYSALMLKTSIDSSDGHIAEMMIGEATSSIVSITKMLNKNKNLTTEAATIGNDIIAFEQSNIDRLRQYL